MTRANINEGYRLPAERPDIYLVNLRDGTRRCVARRVQVAAPNFSPKGRYVFWFDAQDHNFYTYNIQTGRTVNVSAAVKFPLYDESFDERQVLYPFGKGDWLWDDRLMLVSDKYDIWALDPDGERPPVNLSGGYGREKKIRLRFVYLEQYVDVRKPLMSGKDTAAFADLMSGQRGMASSS